MQWLFQLDSQDWLAAARQSSWVLRAQFLLSTGIGLSGLGMYLAAACLRRIPAIVSSRSRR